MRKNLFKRVMGLLLCFSMLASTALAAETVDVTTSGGSGTSQAVVEQEATTFSATIPSVIPVEVLGDGTVVVADFLEIINNNYGPIEVKSITVTPRGSWSLADFDTDFSKEKIGIKKFGFKIQGKNVPTTGIADVSKIDAIAGGSSMLLTYDANVAVQNKAIEETIAEVVFVVGWATKNAPNPEDGEVSGYEIMSIDELDIYDDALVLPQGESANLNAVAVYSRSTPVWSSSDESVLTVSDSGVMTAHAIGYAEITYTVGELSDTIGVWVPGDFEVTQDNRVLVGYTGAEHEALVIPKYVMNNSQLQKVTSIGDKAFMFCYGITTITIPDSVTSIGTDAFLSCNSLTGITLSDSVTCIKNRAFGDCDALISITIPKSVASIGDRVFEDCDELAEIIVDKNNIYFDSRNDCNALIETATNTLVASCKNTVIPDSVTSIGNRAFYNWMGAASITIPNSVTSIGNCAFLNSGLISITIPSSVISIGDSAFCGCACLTSIDISDGVISIGDGAFEGCDNIFSIIIPKSITSIGNNAFKGCCNLTSVTISDGVASIGNSAFEGCENLNRVLVPKSIISIGEYAFSTCRNIATIYYTGTEEEWLGIDKAWTWDDGAGLYSELGTYEMIFEYSGSYIE